MEFDSYVIVFLNRGPRADEYSGEALAELQEQHLAYLAALRDSDYILAAGPFDVAPDYPKRGIAIFSDHLHEDEVKALATADPSVQAGRLSVEVLKWYTTKGSILWPQR